MSLADFQQFASLLGLTIAPPPHGQAQVQAKLEATQCSANRPTRLKKFTPVTILLYKPKTEPFSGPHERIFYFPNVGLGPS
jgi:hypothetical protein